MRKGEIWNFNWFFPFTRWLVKAIGNSIFAAQLSCLSVFLRSFFSPHYRKILFSQWSAINISGQRSWEMKAFRPSSQLISIQGWIHVIIFKVILCDIFASAYWEASVMAFRVPISSLTRADAAAEKSLHHHRSQLRVESEAAQGEEARKFNLEIQFLPNFLHRHPPCVYVSKISSYSIFPLSNMSQAYPAMSKSVSIREKREKRESRNSNKDSFLLWLCWLLFTSIIHKTRLISFISCSSTHFTLFIPSCFKTTQSSKS